MASPKRRATAEAQASAGAGGDREATVSVELLAPFLRCLSESGTEVERLAVEQGIGILATCGIVLHALAEPGARIPHDVAMTLLDNGVRATKDPTFALRAAAAGRQGELGLLEYVSSTAPTLREGSLAARRYIALLHDGAEIELVEHGDRVLWKHRLRHGLRSVVAANEYVVMSFVRTAQRQLGVTTPPIEVGFAHQAPAHAASYEPLFDTRVRFGEECNVIVLPRIAFDLPLAAADASLHALLLRQADSALARLPRRKTFSGRVQKLVRERLAKDCRLTAIAAVLRSSERTVRRRLLAEGTTHSDIVDAVRRELAGEWLTHRDLSVSEISFQLGFSHRPAFHRACVRWFGVSPSEFRERRAQSAFYSFYAS